MPTNLTEFQKHVLPKVPRCPVIIATQAVRDALTEFAKEARVFRVDITPINIVAATSTYTIPNPTNYQVLSARLLRLDGKKLVATSEEALDLDWETLRSIANAEMEGAGDDWSQVECARPGLFYQPTPNTIRLVGIPTEALTAGLTGSVYVYPTASLVEIDDWIFNEFYEGIACGAIARLLALPDQAWSDKNMAMFYRAKFEETVGDARSKGLRGYQRNDEPVIRVRTYAR